MFITEFEFKDTGKKVKIKKVSPMLAVDVEASIPKPTPPLSEVDYGEPKGKVMEPNYSDPGYNKALERRTERVGIAVLKATILRSVTVEGEEWHKEVEEYRAFIQETTGEPLTEPSDLYIYIMRICVGTQDDMEDLMTAITKRSQPTQEEVERAKSSFRS
jgi:hypothetical protein